jgi:murein DD-endopeptidase
MADMPSLGEQPRRWSPVMIGAATVMVLVIVGLVGVKVRRMLAARADPKQAPEAALVVDAGPPPPPPTPVTATPADEMSKAGIKHLHAVIEGPLEKAIIDAAGQELGAPLTQVVTRSLVWWMEVPGDFRKGDSLDVLYEPRANQEPIVDAVRYVSSKLDKTFIAYRFKAAGDSFPRFYLPSGEELELRLKDAPLDDYEQVTSHLRDGRHHKGVDFKTPLGSPVHCPFAGSVARKTWAFHSNGNSLEVQDATGRRVLFLHLSSIPAEIKVGSKIAKGQVIGESGNTGHSFAPHLHYQLMQGEKLLDPFKVQETYKKSIAPDQKAALDAQVRRLETFLAAP